MRGGTRVALLAGASVLTAAIAVAQGGPEHVGRGRPSRPRPSRPRAPAPPSRLPEPPAVLGRHPRCQGLSVGGRARFGHAHRPLSTPTPTPAGSKYMLEGIEVRGNTTTLARAVLRYVPFHSGDVLDVDSRELELTRFRLLSTGFFRDVQLSLRRGTRRGYVILVVTVAERNTIVVDGLWLGASSDVASNGTVRPITAYGGARVTETNLAGTGIALGGAFAIADEQLALRARVSDPQFSGHQLGEGRDGGSSYNAARATSSATATSSSTRAPRRRRLKTSPSRRTSASAAASPQATTSASRRRSSSIIGSRKSTRLRCRSRRAITAASTSSPSTSC